MRSAIVLKRARKQAGFSQRELARRAGMAQPAIARIERGAVVPRVDTLDRLLLACGHGLQVAPRPGAGVDRTVMRELLKLSPRKRLELAAEEAGNLARLLEAAGAR
jgi:transcriptional regulator with XRE-family HTH domain